MRQLVFRIARAALTLLAILALSAPRSAEAKLDALGKLIIKGLGKVAPKFLDKMTVRQYEGIHTFVKGVGKQIGSRIRSEILDRALKEAVEAADRAQNPPPPKTPEDLERERRFLEVQEEE